LGFSLPTVKTRSILTQNGTHLAGESATFFRIDKKENGLWVRKDFYVQGNQLQMKGNLQSVDPEIKVGPYEYYFANGKLKHSGSYNENKETGEHKWYTENGKLEAIENYRDGKLNGSYVAYHPNGKPLMVTSFMAGSQNGKTTYYREDGNKHSEGDFKDGDRNGPWKFYDESGKLANTHEFKTEYIIPEAKMFIKLPNSEWVYGQKRGANRRIHFQKNPNYRQYWSRNNSRDISLRRRRHKIQTRCDPIHNC